MSYRVAKDLLNKIIGQLNLGLHADSPLGHLTLLRAQAIFNQVIPWVYQQPDQDTIIKNASKDKVVNKTKSNTLIEAIRSNPFSHIYDLPSSDEESDQSMSRSESMSSIASDMSVEF